MEITPYRIPYDIDYFLDGFCNGSDLFSDVYGTSVTMLLSDRRSAYFCPEKLKGSWRIYVDASGTEHLIIPPGKRDSRPNHILAWPRAQDVLACGATALPQISVELRSRSAYKRHPTTSSPAVPPFVIEQKREKGWSFRIDAQGVQFTSGSTRYMFSTEDIALQERIWEDCTYDYELGHEFCTTHLGVFTPYASDLSPFIAILEEARAQGDPAQASSFDFAIATIMQSMEKLAEIDTFERACGEIKE